MFIINFDNNITNQAINPGIRKIKEQNLKEDALTNGKIPDFSVPVNGIPGLEERFGLLMIGVNHGIISLNKLVEVSSTNPAKVFGCYPEKGTLEVGSDADIIVVDPERNIRHISQVL